MNGIAMPLARIVLRYLSGALVAFGWFAPEQASQFVNDPDVLVLVAAGVGALIEAWYVFARKHGGPV